MDIISQVEKYRLSNFDIVRYQLFMKYIFSRPVLDFNDLDYVNHVTFISMPPLESLGRYNIAIMELIFNIASGFYYFQDVGFNPYISCSKADENCEMFLIKNCENLGINEKAIVFKTSEENVVNVINENCIEIRADEDNVLKAVNKLLYIFYGVIDIS